MEREREKFNNVARSIFSFQIVQERCNADVIITLEKIWLSKERKLKIIIQVFQGQELNYYQVVTRTQETIEKNHLKATN